MKEVFSDSIMSKGQVRVWHKQFRECTKDKPWTGQPKTAHSEETIASVQNFLQRNHAVCLQDIADHAQISVASADRVVKKDLKLSKLCPKFMPKELTATQKAVRKQMCEDNIKLLQEDGTILHRLLTADESWVSVFEMERKQKSSQWLPKGTHSNHPIKAFPQRRDCKSMLTVFFDRDGVIYSEFAPPRQTIKSETYIQTLRVLKERLRKKETFLEQTKPGRATPFSVASQ